MSLRPAQAGEPSLEEALATLYALSFEDRLEAVLDDPAAALPAVILVDEAIGETQIRALLQASRAGRRLADIPIVYLAEQANSALTKDAIDAWGVVIAKPFGRKQVLVAVSQAINIAIEDHWQGLQELESAALHSSLNAFQSITDNIINGQPLQYDAVASSCQALQTAITEGRHTNILQAVQWHDDYTYVHSMSVATCLSMFGHAIGLKGDDLLMLTTGGLLHDVGKARIPLEVLNKKGKLDQQEWVSMRKHVDFGIEYIQLCEDMPKGVGCIAGQHHEKLDGTGYPKGLAGKQINDLARMAAIVDIFSALTDRRVYKAAQKAEQALDRMAEMSATLDQTLLSTFRSMLLDLSRDFEGDRAY
ncbi:MAG: HD-GYP domain-containing protein [Rhodospirillaceae bacterium]